MSNKDFETDDALHEERAGSSRSGIFVKGLLKGNLLAEKLRRNIVFVLFLTLLGLWYIFNGYATEKLHREKIAIGEEVRELRFESITTAADLMLIRKRSEVLKRIGSEGLELEESKEPPIKLYRK